MYLYNSLAPGMNEMHLRSSIFVCLHTCLRLYKRSRHVQCMESESQYGLGLSGEQTEWAINYWHLIDLSPLIQAWKPCGKKK